MLRHANARLSVDGPSVPGRHVITPSRMFCFSGADGAFVDQAYEMGYLIGR
jgi:hypothetical protein